MGVRFLWSDAGSGSASRACLIFSVLPAYPIFNLTIMRYSLDFHCQSLLFWLTCERRSQLNWPHLNSTSAPHHLPTQSAAFSCILLCLAFLIPLGAYVFSSSFQQLDFFKSGDDEDKESSQNAQCGPGTFFSEAALGDGSSQGSSSRRPPSSTGESSSAPRASTATVPQPSMRGPHPSSGGSSRQAEAVLAQSGAARPQLRNSARSKSISEEISLVREERPRGSQSTRRASQVSGGLSAASRGAAMATDSPAASDAEQQSMSRGSGDSGYPLSENGQDSPPPYQTDDDSAAAALVAGGAAQESPGESPGSWNSRTNRPFSGAHEASDVDAAMDSPSGSPASWSSHPLNRAEADVSRMRKKWGNAQKPIMISASSTLSRRETSKGFKRLLTFGRRTKGAESPAVDWVSASTASEGEDDAEDGRDPSSDLRRPRMGVSHCHYVHDGFDDGDQFHEQGTAFSGAAPII